MIKMPSLATANGKIAVDEKFSIASNLLGDSFSALAGKEQGLAAANFGQIGKRMTGMSVSTKALSAAEREDFLEPLRDFERNIQSVKETFSRRDAKKLVYENAVQVFIDVYSCYNSVSILLLYFLFSPLIHCQQGRKTQRRRRSVKRLLTLRSSWWKAVETNTSLYRTLYSLSSYV